jgi:hypothetical protein
VCFSAPVGAAAEFDDEISSAKLMSPLVVSQAPEMAVACIAAGFVLENS